MFGAFEFRRKSAAAHLDPGDLAGFTFAFVYLNLNLLVRGVDIEIRDTLVFHVRPDGYFRVSFVLAGVGRAE